MAPVAALMDASPSCTWLFTVVNVPATNSRLPTSAMSLMSPLSDGLKVVTRAPVARLYSASRVETPSAVVNLPPR